MRVFLTCPTFSAHGGIRVILEWANRLSRRGHIVYLRTDDRRGCEWFDLDRSVKIEHSDRALESCDTLIVTSPHAVDYLDRPASPARRFAFMQMAEHLFRPRDRRWQAQCQHFYLTAAPLILISHWNWEMVMAAGRQGPVHYVGNGVNLKDFPIESPEKDGKTVLVEGWMPDNPTKDWDRIAARVATRLAREGYRIIGYGRHALPPQDRYRRIPQQFIVRPSLEQLNRLYREATILIKASRCDARACAPLEAMTKGTVTARAIEQGDDDLVHEENALRCLYNETALYAAARRLLDDYQLRARLGEAGRAWVQEQTWDAWMDVIEGILCAESPALARSA